MKSNIIKIIFIIIFIIYVTLFFSNETGYYEYQNRIKKEMTEEQIKKFEEDVKNGVPVDINNYIDTTEANYQNNFSNLGENTSNIISTGISKSVNKTFNFIIKFMG